MANIHFYIHTKGSVKQPQEGVKPKNYKKTPQPIYLTYRFGRNGRFLYPTGFKIEPEYWNEKEYRVRNITDILDKDKINNFLNELQTVTESFITDLKISKKEITKNELKNFLNNYIHPSPINEKTFIGHCQKFINDINSRVNSKTGQLISYKTKRDYCRTFEFIKEYQRVKGKDIDFQNIDLDFYQDFTEFLQNGASKNKKGEIIKLSTNTISHKIQSLKAMLNDATDKGLNKNMSFKSPKFKAVKEESESVYLNDKELSIIENHDFSDNDRLDKVRDLFLFGAWTGLRFSDFTRITNDSIDKNGRISIKQQKTGKPVIIPLHPTVKRIWNKYNGKLPRNISNQKFNDYIKEVCEICKINDTFHKGITKGGTHTSTRFEKYQLVSSHTARRSFATNMYNSGFPSISIMNITGHKTEQAFLKYIKVTPEDHAKLLEMHWNKTISILKIS